MWQQRQHASPTFENAKREVQLPTRASPRNPEHVLQHQPESIYSHEI
ncbi:hypothetical protein X738_29580 [Mesorhizobium sp. LNHC209A00]|nr:hypothetical protein X738_29580 [Mesorhizobium sp. LNHC209A00]